MFYVFISYLSVTRVFIERRNLSTKANGLKIKQSLRGYYRMFLCINGNHGESTSLCYSHWLFLCLLCNASIVQLQDSLPIFILLSRRNREGKIIELSLNFNFQHLTFTVKYRSIEQKEKNRLWNRRVREDKLRIVVFSSEGSRNDYKFG